MDGAGGIAWVVCQRFGGPVIRDHAQKPALLHTSQNDGWHVAFLFKVPPGALVCSYFQSFIVHLLFCCVRGFISFDPHGESPGPRPSHSLDNFV